jgi:hypothetical protein
MLASALYEQGRCAEALPYAQMAYQMLGYDHPGYLLLLGDVFWCLEDSGQAVSVYQKLESVSPGYAPYVLERINSTR